MSETEAETQTRERGVKSRGPGGWDHGGRNEDAEVCAGPVGRRGVAQGPEGSVPSLKVGNETGRRILGLVVSGTRECGSS